MAKLKSSKKRIRSNRRKEQRNVSVKTSVKTAIKNVEKAVATRDIESARASFSEVASVLDSAVAKGIMKKKAASRKKSRLAKSINTVQAAD